MIEFGVLGTLIVTRERIVVEIPALLPRLLLAVLVSRVNRPVPVDDVIDALWTGDPPASARKLVQVYIHRLRTLLGDPGRIRHEHGGYRLVTEPSEVDALRFTDLISRAREAVRANDLHHADQLLTEALGLWRDDPFTGLPATSTLAAEAARLAGLFVAALEDWFGLQLAAGRHDDIVADLARHATAHPFQERLRVYHMLALYRCGRQAESLEVFRCARSALVEELGVEPGALLQLMHQAVLRGDPRLMSVAPTALEHLAEPPALAPQPATAQTGALRTPAQLPTGIPMLVGRLDDVRRLDALLTDAVVRSGIGICVISGQAGIGKTALAVHWARRIAHRFPDGQLYTDLMGFTPVGNAVGAPDAVRGFLEALGVRPVEVPSDPRARTAILRTLLATRRVLILLDNARDADQVRPILAGAAGSLVMVTSRNQLPGLVATDGARPIGLDLLKPDHARELLALHIDSDRLDTEPAATDDIITACAGLPLALSIVAARAATQPRMALSSLANELRDASLDALSGVDPSTDLRAVISWSYHALSEPAARMFRLLGLHVGPHVSITATASLAAVTTSAARRLLRELVHANLVAEHPAGRFSMHDLVRSYAGELAGVHEPVTGRRAALQRLLDHYLHTAAAAAMRIYPHRHPIDLVPVSAGVQRIELANREAAMHWSTEEHPVLIAAVEQAAARGFEQHAWQLAWALITYFDRRGHVHDQAATQRIALAAATRIADRLGQAYAHYGLGIAATWARQTEAAEQHYHQALDHFSRLPADTGAAETQLALAWLVERDDRLAQALIHAERALALHRAAANPSGVAKALNYVGWHCATLGDLSKALRHCEEALALFHELDDPIGQADTWDSIAYIHHQRGQVTEAVTCFERARELYEANGDMLSVALVLTHLGQVHSDRGEKNQAGAVWRQAEAIYRRLDHPDAAPVRGKLDELR